jgi:hypothetical protein
LHISYVVTEFSTPDSTTAARRRDAYGQPGRTTEHVDLHSTASAGAVAVGITERTAAQIVNELEQAG